MISTVFRYPSSQYVVVAAFDDIDSVYSHITKVLNRRQRRIGIAPERRHCIQSLRVQPNASSISLGQSDECGGSRSMWHGNGGTVGPRAIRKIDLTQDQVLGI
jgi:hypothetical protein